MSRYLQFCQFIKKNADKIVNFATIQKLNIYNLRIDHIPEDFAGKAGRQYRQFKDFIIKSQGGSMSGRLQKQADGGLPRTLRGLCQVTVTPTDVDKPASQMVTIPPRL